LPRLDLERGLEHLGRGALLSLELERLVGGEALLPTQVVVIVVAAARTSEHS
jgi:hypothetical protein